MKQINQIRTFSEIEKNILESCRDAICKITSNPEIILYGSRARGDATDDSDFDILVLVEGQVDVKTEDVIRQQTYPIELEYGYVLSVQVFSKRDWQSKIYRSMPFHRNVEKDGILI